MKEYKIIETSPRLGQTEQYLNELATEGWTVTGFIQHQVLLEREKQDELQQQLLFED